MTAPLRPAGGIPAHDRQRINGEIRWLCRRAEALRQRVETRTSLPASPRPYSALELAEVQGVEAPSSAPAAAYVAVLRRLAVALSAWETGGRGRPHAGAAQLDWHRECWRTSGPPWGRA